MNMKRIFLVFVSLIISVSFVIYADTLPVKTIGNTEFYCYKVKSKETLFGISKKFNITQDELKLYNPAVVDGLKKDHVLLLPVALIDSYKVYNSWQIAPVTTQVYFLEPIYYEEYKDMKTPQIAELVKERIQKKITEVTGV